MKEYSVGGMSGCVGLEKSDDTGATVQIFRCDQAGIPDEDGKWAVVCEHSNILNVASLKLARWDAKHPSEWCEECGAGRRGNPLVDGVIQIDESLFANDARTLGWARKANLRLREGKTIAAEYDDIRSSLSRAFEEAWKAWLAPLPRGMGWDLRSEGATGGTFNSIAKSRRVVAKTRLLGASDRASCLALLDAYADVLQGLNHLKTLIVKRKVLTTEQKQQEKADRIVPKNKFEQQIYDAVMALKPDIEEGFSAAFESRFNSMVKACSSLGWADWSALLHARTSSGYRGGRFVQFVVVYRRGAKELELNEKEVVEWQRYSPMLMLYLSISTDGFLDRQKLASVSAWEAKMVCLAMIHKLYHKVSVLDEPAMRRGDDWGSFLLSGRLEGKKIQIEQSTKMNRSPLGKVFYQFPALIYVDGKMVPEANFLDWSDQIKR